MALPTILTYSWQSNLANNGRDLISMVKLEPCGTKVDIRNALGSSKVYDIAHLRRPNDRELKVI